MQKNKYKYLLKNVGLLTISNFGTKILSFILIPLYTKILTTAEYGTYDVYATTLSLAFPILTSNIIDGVMRFSLDKNQKKDEIFSIGLRRIIIAICIFTILVLVNTIFNIIPIFVNYFMFFILLFVFELFYSLLSQFSRGLENVVDLAIAGAINSIIILVFNVIFLVYIKLGLKGYFLANLLGYIIPCIYLIFKLKIWKYIKINNENKKLKKEMLSYSRPMVFNTMGWWITNVSDRYLVTWLCGVAANGVYSVAYKIPSILNIFQNVFYQAWTLSAVKEYEEGNNKFFSDIYKIYNCGMVIICSGLILGDRIMARILFSNDFFSAWKYSPFLMISVVFGAMYGLISGIFSALKKSGTMAKITSLGAITNVILNFILIKFIGPIGAAIATLIAYIVVWQIGLVKIKKIVEININENRDKISYVLLILQAAILYIDMNIIITYLLECVFVGLIMILYFKDIGNLLKKIFEKIKEKKNI